MTGATHRAHLNAALLTGVAVLASVWLAHVPGMSAGLAYLGPAVFAFVLLWLGRYPGESALLALGRRRRPRRAKRTRAGRRPLVNRRIPRGGELLATGLAGRAPPPLSSWPH